MYGLEQLRSGFEKIPGRILKERVIHIGLIVRSDGDSSSLVIGIDLDQFRAESLCRKKFPKPFTQFVLANPRCHGSTEAQLLSVESDIRRCSTR